MGTSTDAIIVYGIPLSDNADSILIDSDNDNHDVLESLIEGKIINGICFLHHCSSNYTMYIVAIENSEQFAWRGNPIKIDTEKLSNDIIGMSKKILDFVDKYKLKTEGEVGWWLASYWG